MSVPIQSAIFGQIVTAVHNLLAYRKIMKSEQPEIGLYFELLSTETALLKHNINSSRKRNIMKVEGKKMTRTRSVERR